MNKEQILKIIDDLTKNNKKLRGKDLTNDEAIFVHFGAVKFLCDFETGPLKVIFQFARPIDTFFENDFEEFYQIIKDSKSCTQTYNKTKRAIAIALFLFPQTTILNL